MFLAHPNTHSQTHIETSTITHTQTQTKHNKDSLKQIFDGERYNIMFICWPIDEFATDGILCRCARRLYVLIPGKQGHTLQPKFTACRCR